MIYGMTFGNKQLSFIENSNFSRVNTGTHRSFGKESRRLQEGLVQTKTRRNGKFKFICHVEGTLEDITF